MASGLLLQAFVNLVLVVPSFYLGLKVFYPLMAVPAIHALLVIHAQRTDRWVHEVFMAVDRGARTPVFQKWRDRVRRRKSPPAHPDADQD